MCLISSNNCTTETFSCGPRDYRISKDQGSPKHAVENVKKCYRSTQIFDLVFNLTCSVTLSKYVYFFELSFFFFFLAN